MAELSAKDFARAKFRSGGRGRRGGGRGRGGGGTGRQVPAHPWVSGRDGPHGGGGDEEDGATAEGPSVSAVAYGSSSDDDALGGEVPERSPGADLEQLLSDAQLYYSQVRWGLWAWAG
eukprot:359232-Chlamydomonas_euryale.AAC.5